MSNAAAATKSFSPSFTFTTPPETKSDSAWYTKNTRELAPACVLFEKLRLRLLRCCRSSCGRTHAGVNRAGPPGFVKNRNHVVGEIDAVSRIHQNRYSVQTVA